VESSVANTRVGTVKACRRAYLAPAVGGQVVTLNVREGNRVDKDQLLMEIWNEDLKAQVRLAVSESAASQARAEEACLVAESAEREARRQIRLQKDKLVSEEAVDLVITQARSKRAACEAAQASLKVSEARIDVARSALERTIVRAPFAGVIAEINAELGEFVTPSPPGIATLPAIDLLDLSCLYVSAPIDEVDAAAIRTEMKASVTLDAFPRRKWSGMVRRIAPYVLDREKQARTVDVEAEINNPEELEGLLPGYSADIEVLLDARDNVLRVPTEAVLEGHRVLVYREADGRLVERSFEPGISNWEYTEVISGLEAGEWIALSVGKPGVEAGTYAVPESGTAIRTVER
jgi:RND family efflux transporter, MFP subunit